MRRGVVEEGTVANWVRDISKSAAGGRAGADRRRLQISFVSIVLDLLEEDLVAKTAFVESLCIVLVNSLVLGVHVGDHIEGGLIDPFMGSICGRRVLCVHHLLQADVYLVIREHNVLLCES